MKEDTKGDALAKQTYQSVIDGFSQALMDGDADFVAARLSIPFTLTTELANLTLDTKDMVHTIIHHHAEALGQAGCTAYFRLAISARLAAEDVLEGEHSTHVLRGTARLVPPYVARATFRKVGTEWHCAKIVKPAMDAVWPLGLPDIPPGQGFPFTS
ncbi:MAG: hypothetical protein AAGF74_07525 [Pseudomonadota bacterium]